MTRPARYLTISSRDNETVWLHDNIADDEYPLGSIDDADNCPPGMEREWALLLADVRDDREAVKGYEAAVNAAWNARFDGRNW